MKLRRDRYSLSLALVAAGLLLVGGTGNADKIKSNPDLVPDGEKERMGSHSADATKIGWRPGKGLAVTSEDGEFGLITRLRLQTLATFEKHPFKIQADAFQLWSDGFSDGATRVRVQMQFSF